VLDVAALQQILAESFSTGPSPYRVTEVTERGAVLTLDESAAEIRPGGTVSGPTLMALADCVAWLATLARIGPVLLTVTSSLNMHFLAKPQPGALRATGVLLRLGQRQSVTEVHIYSSAGTANGDEVLVAQATVVYAIPSIR
jgi:acyl-coenzyme A thioesterase PaaI-like protein